MTAQGVKGQPMLATAASAERWRLRGVRILVVDDDEDVRDSLLGILEHFGAEVDAADGAAAARALLGERRYDVLVSDLEMPCEDGYSLIRGVRGSRAAGIAAAAVTGCLSSDARARAIDAGFDCVIAKPTEMRALVDAVGALVGRG